MRPLLVSRMFLVIASGIAVSMLLIVFGGVGYALVLGLVLYSVFLLTVFGVKVRFFDQLIQGESVQEIFLGPLSVPIKAALVISFLMLFFILIFLILSGGYF